MKKLLPISKPDFFSTQVSQARRFYFNLKPSPNTKLVVVCGGVEHCAPDYTISRKSFPFYSVEFVAQGSGRLKLNHSEHVLQPGSVFSYGPHIPHDIFTTSHHPLIKYFVDLPAPMPSSFLNSPNLNLVPCHRFFHPRKSSPSLTN